MEPYGLALFAQFIAVSELAVGAMLMTRRLATLGAIMLAPMLICILVITVSLEWAGTPYVNGILLLLNVAILAYDYPKWRTIFTDSNPSDNPTPATASWSRVDLVWTALLALILASPLFGYWGSGLLHLLAISAVVVVGLVAVERLNQPCA